ncbi:MAG: hypothetical protein ACHQD9_08060 [Chitinophagales bacterium]
MNAKLLFTLSFILLLSTRGFSQAPQTVMDGKQYKIDLMKDGKFDSKETLVFDKGMMDPIDCHQYGFSATRNNVKQAGDLITFMVICKSEKEGTMNWQGKVTGENVEGSVSWVKEGQATINYTFKGQEVKPEK